MRPTVICISGRIGTGKTSLADALAQARGAAVASFGAFVRAEAAARDLDSSQREVLQDLGAILIQEKGYAAFCREVIAGAHWDGQRELVIDGVRHALVLDAIEKLCAPARTVLVHLVLTSEADLAARGDARGVGTERRAHIEQHSTEQDVLNTLPQRADLILPAEGSLEDTVRVIGDFLSVR